MGRDNNPRRTVEFDPGEGGLGHDGSGTVHVSREIRCAREQIQSVESPEGSFTVACKETGVSPDPVSDRTFRTYDHAELACLAARRYRKALRKLDPSLREYDLGVTAIDDESVEITSVRQCTPSRRDNGLPTARQTVTLAGGGNDEWLRIQNGPVVHLTGPDRLLDDEFVARQLDSKL